MSQSQVPAMPAALSDLQLPLSLGETPLGVGQAFTRDLSLARGRHVDLRTEEVHELAGLVEDRAEIEFAPERAAVLAVVQELDLHLPLSGDRVPYAGYDGGIRVGTLEEAAVAPEHLVGTVPRQREEGRVREDDGVVWQTRVRDDHRMPGALQGGDEGPRTTAHLRVRLA